MKTFRAELHVHTVLSPCALVEMIPPLIVSVAVEQGIDLLAITDHNGTDNIRSVQKAAEGTGLVVLPGMEIQTREEVHSLCLFDTLKQAEQMQSFVDHYLPNVENNADFFGEQFVVDETGEFIRHEYRLLINSVNVSFEQAWEKVREIGGLFIPAHVNRKGFGLIANLGLVPDSVPLDALEISRHITPTDALKQFPQIRGYPLIQNGDVHSLDGFLGATVFEMESPVISELRLAIRCQDGRSYKIEPLAPS